MSPVLAEIDDWGLVCSRLIIDHQFVLVGQRVSDPDLGIAGEAIVAVFAEVGVRDGRLALQCFAVPNNLVERLVRAAVEGVRAVILRQRVRLAVQNKCAIGNAVGIASDDGANVRRVRNIAFESLVTENDIGKLTFAVRDADRKNDAAIIHGVDFDTL